MAQPVFLFGAGFNADAVNQAGPIEAESVYIGRHKVECVYPYGDEILRVCSLVLTAGKSREAGDSAVDNLADCLGKADFWVATRLASGTSNCYHDFFARFRGADFLTFNYD